MDAVDRDTIVAVAGLWLVATFPYAFVGLIRARLRWPLVSIAPVMIAGVCLTIGEKAVRNFMLIFALLALVAALYAFVLRPWLRKQPTIGPWLDHLDTVYLAFFQRSRTVLIARLYWLAGALLGLHDFALPLVAGPEFQPLIPPEWLHFYPFAMAVTGAVFEWLRKVTTKPVDQA